MQAHREAVHEEVSEFDGLLTDDLMARAKSLGVTTHVGSKWRTTAELRRACKRAAQNQGSLGAYFRRPQVAQACGHAAVSAPGPDCAGGGAEAAEPPVGIAASAPASASAGAGMAAQPARAGRNKERRAKRYAADPVWRETVKAQKKAWIAKRYAEDPVYHQTKHGGASATRSTLSGAKSKCVRNVSATRHRGASATRRTLAPDAESTEGCTRRNAERALEVKNHS